MNRRPCRVASVILVGSFIDCAAITSPTRVILFSMLVSDLATRLASSILSTFQEAGIEIGSDQTLVELGTSNVLQAVQRILVCIVFDEAEAAGGFLESVEAHNNPFDFTAPACQLDGVPALGGSWEL